MRGFEETPRREQRMILTALKRPSSPITADAMEAGAFLNGGRSEEAVPPNDEGIPPGPGTA